MSPIEILVCSIIIAQATTSPRDKFDIAKLAFIACFQELCGENYGLRIIELLNERRELEERIERLASGTQ